MSRGKRLAASALLSLTLVGSTGLELPQTASADRGGEQPTSYGQCVSFTATNGSGIEPGGGNEFGKSISRFAKTPAECLPQLPPPYP
jgi:hypothetical protein